MLPIINSASTTAMEALQRRRAASSNSQTTFINIVSWILLVLVVAMLITRFAMKFSRKTNRRVFAQDDVFLLLAAVFSFGQTVAILIQWSDTAAQGKEVIYQKAAYASSILFIANMGCAKISLSLTMQKLFTSPLFEYTSLILALFTAGWTVSGIFVTVFQCRLPMPWDVLRRDGCIDVVAFGNYLASMNIATEFMLVLVPLAVWVRGSSVGNRIYVFAAFFLRLSVVAAICTQLYVFNTSTPNSWSNTLCMQIVQALSIASACLPGLHPLIAKEMIDNTSSYSTQAEKSCNWDSQDFSSLSSHSPNPGVASEITLDPLTSPYCRPLATHGLIRSSASCDSYSFPHMPSNIALSLSTPNSPENVFNRLVGDSSTPPGLPSLDLDPLSIPRSISDLGCLPALEWEENVETGRMNLERRPTSEYVFNRSKVISVLERGSVHEMEREWSGFVPPVPEPQRSGEPSRTFG